MDRRNFMTGLLSLVAAPAIVRINNIMPVKVMPVLPRLADLIDDQGNTAFIDPDGNLIGEIAVGDHRWMVTRMYDQINRFNLNGAVMYWGIRTGK